MLRMGKLIDQNNLRLSRQNAIDVHLLKVNALIIDLPARNLFQLRSQLRGAWPAMRLDDADHDIFSALMPPNRLAQHVVRLADAGRITKKELEGALRLLRRNLFQPLFRALCGGDSSFREQA